MADMDTAAKRYSAMGWDLPFHVILPQPTGTIDAAARQHFLRKYVGILFTAISGPAYGIDDLTTAVRFYLRTLFPGDQSDEYRAYLNLVRGTTNEDDLNTAQWVDLNF